MAIYFGYSGQIELARKTQDGAKFSSVNPGDVSSDRNRFSFDFDEGFLISGDLVEITTTDNTNLDFIAASGWANATVQSSGNWFVFVDDIGGIRLYNSFDDSLEGGSTGAVDLVAINRTIPIRVVVRNRDSRILGSVVEYEINTNREVVDTTTLSDEFRQQYSTLISGSGRLTAHWDYVNTPGYESVNYLMQLVLRTEAGSLFQGKFYIKSPAASPESGGIRATQLNDALWWEFDGLITSAGVSFTTDQIIVGTIDFVTTGPIKLKARTEEKRYLLQEDNDKIELEQYADSYLVLEELD